MQAPDSLSNHSEIELDKRVDKVCSSFENDWLARNGIESYTERVPDRKNLLLSELILVELDLAQRLVDDPQAAYLKRFPAEQEAIREALAKRAQRIREDDQWFEKGSANQRYEKLRLHATGGLGRVYVGTDKMLSRKVAIKEIRPDHYGVDNVHQRFRHEVDVTGHLDHPGIASVYDFGVSNQGVPFYVMRFVDGQTFQEKADQFHKSANELSSNQKRLALRKFVDALLNICQTVGYAHEQNILHGDLKPSNIVIGKHGETVVIDWGMARPLKNNNDEVVQNERPTGDSSTVVLGTPSYMSPEQASGDEHLIGPATDVFGVGATLYFLLTAKPPRQASSSTTQQIRDAQKTLDQKKPSEINPDTDRALEAICLKAIASGPDHRYTTLAGLAKDLELWLAGEPVGAYPETFSDRIGRSLIRHKTTVIVSCAILLVSLILLAVLTGLLAVSSQQQAKLYQKQKRLSQQQETLVEQLGISVKKEQSLVEDLRHANEEQAVLVTTLKENESELEKQKKALQRQVAIQSAVGVLSVQSKKPEACQQSHRNS